MNVEDGNTVYQLLSLFSCFLQTLSRLGFLIIPMHLMQLKQYVGYLNSVCIPVSNMVYMIVRSPDCPIFYGSAMKYGCVHVTKNMYGNW